MNVRDDLKAYLDGEQSPERAREVEQAIAQDAELRREVDEMKLLGLEIRRVAAMPNVYGAEVAMSAVRGRRPRFRPLAFAGVGLALAVIVIAAFPTFQQAKMAQMETASAGEAVAPMDGAMAPGADSTIKGAPSERTGQEDQGLSYGGGAAAAGKAAQTEPANGAGGFRDMAKTEIERTPVVPTDDAVGGRRVIRTANMGLKVKEAAKAQSEAQSLATRLGGFVASSSLSEDQEGLPSASVVLRVPEKAFDAAMNALRKLGKPTSEVTDGQDVTASIADTAARLKVMRAEEESYVTMLRGARKVGELLEIKERLSAVRQEIESTDAQRKALLDQSALSTISATFEQRPDADKLKAQVGWADDAWGSAVNSLRGVGRLLGSAAINLFVFSPVWLPILLGSLFVLRRKA